MKVKATHSTIKQILAHADAIAKAFARMQDLVTTAAIPAPESVRKEIGAILYDMNVVPVEALYSLREISNFYADEAIALEKAADAVRKHRERKENGWTQKYRPRTTRDGKKSRAAQSPEICSSEEYEEIARMAQAGKFSDEGEERATPEPQPLIDATPKTGKASLDF